MPSTGLNIVGMMPVRNEAWILDFSVRAAMRWCDALVILDHASTDATPAVINALQAAYPFRIVGPRESDPTWNEAKYRQRLLNEARRLGATHCCLLDADEALTANLLPRIRDMAESLSPGDCLKLPWLCCWRSLTQYRADESTFGRARVPVVFRDSPRLTYDPDREYQIHSRIPIGARIVDKLDREDGGVMHFQHAEWRRLAAKQALYQMTELLRWGEVKANYAGTVDETGLQRQETPAEWWAGYDLGSIVLGTEPWQEVEVRKLITVHGRERFAGLDLFGVV